MKKGFTLLELLIVITILAILAGAMMPIFSTSRTEAQMAKAKADLDAIKSAAVMLHYDSGRWPPDGSTGTCLAVNASGCDGTGEWRGPYLASWERDPWNVSYRIYNGSSNTLYVASTGLTAGFQNCADVAGNNTADVCVLITSNRTQ